ncbi:peptidase inhibitor family I36 protein [Nocardia iowensis]|uniref:Peptidase inhibitor family I36 protein n=1 Tax=Nocardia iowensis TaxID=204891 RepID=A0ABX8S0J2_NOCIO|nr:peptidase inhibitor family I36 protein [Nocardia iowensis]QXN94622.1 peptidase inhibitor family I36 protein [Nocardia iowensis]
MKIPGWSAVMLALVLGASAPVAAAPPSKTVPPPTVTDPSPEPRGTQGATCDSGRFCLYEHINYEGYMAAYRDTSPIGQCYDMGVFDNKASSLNNNGSADAYVYDQPGCQGDFIRIWSGERRNNLKINFFPSWNDRISSIKFM